VIGADHPYRKPIQIDALQGAEVGCPFRVKLGNTRNEQPVGNWKVFYSFVIDHDIPFAYERPLCAKSGIRN
jgi:hypothetical protein